MTTTDTGTTPDAMTVLPHRDALGVGHGRCYIDGQWVEGSEGATWTHVHPATDEEVTTFAVASEADVDRAVRSARRAFDDGSWSTMQARDRRRLLQRVATLLGDNIDELNRIQALDNGIPVEFTSIYQLSAEMAADVFDFHAGWVDRIAGQTLPDYEGQRFQTLTLREPVRVVGAIIPWNAPLMLFAQKVAPALAAGCTVVLKPSEYATLVTIRMTELLVEAGVPEGVFHLVLGPGDPTGEALVTHPATDKITFTGSRAVGRHIMAAGADRVARLSLELGGKSPNIIFPDVDLDLVAMSAMGMVSMGLSGQGCVCHTRALVHESIYDDFLVKAEAFTSMVRMGNPFDSGINAGPIINGRQLDRILGMVDAAGADGARLVTGGKRGEGALAQGNFVQPTLFADVDNSMTIAREEVFGPVLAAIPFADEDEAIRLANDSDYGLGASVQTNDVARAIRVAKAVRSGTFGVNGYTVSPHAPFGGYKTSGLGREGGREGIDEFLETKTVTIAF